MYFIGIAVFLAFIVSTTMIDGSFAAFFDAPSLVVILGLSLSMLLASGLFKDFLRGFKVITSKENIFSLIELKKTLRATNLYICLLLTSGFLGSLIGIVSMLSQISDIHAVGPSVAIALLTFLYSILFVFILLPIRARVQAVIITIE